MTWNIISPRVGRETAEVLQSYLNIEHPIEREVKVNWGNSAFNLHPSPYVWGNSTSSVARSVDKGIFFSLCKDLGTVPVVSTVNEVGEPPHGYFIHDDATGHNGSGVRYTLGVLSVVEAIQAGKLVTKEVKGQEFRVYFCYNMEPQVYAKVPLTENTPHNPIQNSFNGYGYIPANVFFKKISGLQSILKEYTKKVSSRLELSYGAVDFIMSEDYTVYVLESNTAPTLFNESLCSSFATAIAEVWNV